MQPELMAFDTDAAAHISDGKAVVNINIIGITRIDVNAFTARRSCAVDTAAYIGQSGYAKRCQ